MTRMKKGNGVSDSKAGFSLLGALTAGLVIAAMAGMIALAPAKTDARILRGDAPLNLPSVMQADDEPVSEDIIEVL